MDRVTIDRLDFWRYDSEQLYYQRFRKGHHGDGQQDVLSLLSISHFSHIFSPSCMLLEGPQQRNTNRLIEKIEKLHSASVPESFSEHSLREGNQN